MAKVNTQKQLAALLSISEGTVSKYLNRPDWPARRSAPWNDKHIADIRAWQLTLQEDRSDKRVAAAGVAPSDSRDFQAIKLKGQALKVAAQAEQESIRTKHMRGKLVDAETVEKALNGITAMFVRSINNLVAAAPSQLTGDKVANRATLKRLTARIREDLIAQRAIELQTIEDYTAKVVEGKKKT